MACDHAASSLSLNHHFFTHDTKDHYTHPAHDYERQYLPTPQSALPIAPNSEYTFSDAAIFSEALALLQQPVTFCMNTEQYYAANPNIRLQSSTPTPAFDTRQDSVVYGNASAQLDWPQQQMLQSMGAPAVSQTQGLKRARSHQRTPSASTIASNGPSSPFSQTYSHPHIANTDFAPNSPAHFADQASSGLFSKQLFTPTQTPTDSTFFGAGYMPSQAAHTGGAHQAMKGFVIDHHNGEDFAPEYTHSGRQSMSSYGNDSPATPQSGMGETVQNTQYNLPQNDYRQPNANVQLFRTDSQAYQDELYNPPTTYTSAPATATKTVNNYLSPHRNLVTERLQTANNVRSHSPTSSVSRERSPFRDGSPLAPAGWRTPGDGLPTAAGMRQQQKEQADQAELAHHRPQLQREPTKTISPKEALLDYNEQEQPSLFHDNIPAGYRQHNGGTDQWPSNNFVSQPGSAFGSLQTPSQQAYSNFRATSADAYSATDALSYVPLPPSQHDQSQIQTSTYPTASYAASKMAPNLDHNPEFPAHLTSMESSMSDNGPPPSSQDSLANTSAAPQRPADTRAATGTYTCTYHGCTQRFESHAALQNHKRDFHRSQQHSREASGATSSGEASTSPRSTESPAPSGAGGMTSAALMARNSQAGPHKCTRINPSTNKPCNTIFSRPYDLTRHEDTIHNGRKQKVRCPMCREEKTFSRNDALTRHMRVVHPEVESFGKRGRRGE